MTPTSLESILRFDKERRDIIRRTFCKDVSDEEAEIFIYTCEQVQLDPFLKQIYCLSRRDKMGKTHMYIVTGIDGYRSISDRTGCYAPGKEPTYAYSDKGQLFSATTYVKKMTSDGTWHEVGNTAFLAEYKPKNCLPSSPWMTMPHIQLAKCAEALCHRKAFPGRHGQIYIREEMDQAENVPTPPKPPVETISPEQHEIIKTLIAQADPEYVDRCRQALSQGTDAVTDLAKLPARMYDRFIAGLTKNIESKLSKEMAEVGL